MTLIQPDLGATSSVLHINEGVKEKKEMLSVLEAPDGRTHVRINSSSLAIIQECLRKAQYALLQGWTAQDESPATVFGKAIHKALEVFYLGGIDERRLPRLEDVELAAFGHSIGDGLVERSISAFVREANQLTELPATDKRSITNGVWILHEYFKTYINDPYVAYCDSKGPFMERDFSLRLFEDSSLIIDIFGRIDFAFLHTATGEITPGDHKTTSFLSFHDSSYFDRDKPNHQYTMYAMGANRVYGIPADNFLVNIIEVKARPKTKAARGVSFPRQITKRTEEDFEELTETLIWYVRQYLRAREKSMWPLGGVDACNKFGSCQFKQVCASPQSMRETLLNNKFTKDRR